MAKSTKKHTENLDPILKIGKVGKVIISEDLKKEIDYLHKKVGSTEWSGMLIYEQISGDFDNLENLVFEAKHVYPLNIGVSTYTEIDYDGEVANIMSDIPETMTSSVGKIHTHHNMTAYHSSTDISDIQKNAKVYGSAFLSLTVATDDKYDAKLGIAAKTKTSFQCDFKNLDNNDCLKNFSNEVNHILLADLEVEVPGTSNVPEWLKNQYKKVVNKSKVSKQSEISFPGTYEFPKPGQAFGSEDDPIIPTINDGFFNLKKLKKWLCLLLGGKNVGMSYKEPDELIQFFLLLSIEEATVTSEEIVNDLYMFYDLAFDMHDSQTSLFDIRLGNLIQLIEKYNISNEINLNILIKHLKDEKNR